MLLNTGNKKDLIMKLYDLDTSKTKQSQKVFESYFGNGVDFSKMSPQACSTMLRKVRTLISETRTHTSERDPRFIKMLVMERGLVARMQEADVKIEPAIGATNISADGKHIGTAKTPAAAAAIKAAVDKGELSLGTDDLGEGDYSAKKARAGKDIGKPGKNFAKIAKSAAKKYGSKAAGERVAGAVLAKLRDGAVLKMNGVYLKEDEVQQAQVVLAAQDMVDRIQKMLEDVTEMQFKDLPALSASISSTVGTNESQAFNQAAGAALATLVDAVQAAKVGMEGAQGTLTGQEPVVPGEEVAPPPGTEVPEVPGEEVDVDVSADEMVPDVEEPEEGSLGRARR